MDFTIHVINELSIVDEIISSGLSDRNVSRKSRNDKREKLSYFFHVFDIVNQLLPRHSPFVPFVQVDDK